jgi:hypothetical protein
MPDDIPEGKANYLYIIITAPCIGEQIQEVWNVKIEYSGGANDDLKIAGWTFDRAGAGTVLDKGVIEHFGPIEKANNTKIQTSERLGPDMDIFYSE